MLRGLVRLSLEHRYAVVIGAAALLVVGIVAASRYPLDVFPEFAPPLVEIQTEAPGMSSESVESLVTIPLESAVNGIPRLTTLRSKSVQGLSSIVLLFEQGADLFQVRQMVNERLASAAPNLPLQVKTPKLLPPLSSTSRVLHIGLTPKAQADLQPGEPVLDQTEISVLMRWVIEPRLLRVPGVANVSTYGQHDKQYQVLVRPADLRAFGLTLQQVQQGVRDGVVYGSAGFHDTPNQRLAMQYATRIRGPEDLKHLVIAHRGGVPIYLGQIATITTGNPPPIGEGVIQDQAGLFVVVEKYPWGNTLEVTRAVEEALDTLRPSLPGVHITQRIFRPATFIEVALANLRVAMIIGCALVALILLAFLFEWRTAVISLTAIPLSIVAALVALGQLGMTINTMVLAGLAIAIGEVVDDAIIDVENIVRRLRENRLKEQPRSALRVVLQASLEVRSAVVYATFIVVCVCIPIFFLGGDAGSFFRPLALAYIFAVMASLLVALTITPAMCLILLPHALERTRDPWLTRGIKSVYGWLLPPILNQPEVVFMAILAMALGSGYLVTQLKEAYLPQFQENDFLMHWVAKPGTGLDVMREDIQKVGRELLDHTPVKEHGSHIARAEVGEEVVGPNFAELWVSLGDYTGDYALARRQIETIMAQHPGFQHDLLTYLQERIKEVLSGASATIVLRIYGPELEGLRDRAQEVHAAINTVEGVIDLKVESQVLVPQLSLTLDPARLAPYGLQPKEVGDRISTLLHGSVVAEVHQGQRKFDIAVRAHPEISRTIADMGRWEIDLPGGKGTAPLAALADLRLVNAPNTIRHDKASRCIDVTCNIKGRDLGGVVADINTRLKALEPRAGYRVELLGEYKARAENQTQLLGYGVLALVGIALLLFMDFQSLRLTLLVLFTLPFALIGGVAAAFLTGGVLSLGSLVGFITVLGITARNGIMLVSHYRHLEREEGEPFGRAMIIRGAMERVTPILMTALAAGLGLLPLALSGNKPGYEVEYPMAIVILGGLATSTLLNLLVVPVLYERFGHVRPSVAPARDN